MNPVMESLKQRIWWVIKALKVDELIAARTGRDSPLRVAIPRSRAYRAEKYEYSVSDNLQIVIDRSDYTQWRIFSGSLFINEDIPRLLNARKGPLTVMDIGANIGAFSILLSSHLKGKDCAYHFFEPNPTLLPTLIENTNRLVQSNGRVYAQVNDFAIGAKKDVLTLNVVKGHSGIATLGKQSGIDHTVDVKVIPLDQYVKENEITALDFIKLDVESFEPAVFHGAQRTIAKFKPIIYFEYSHEWFGNFSDEYINEVVMFFNGLNYQFFRENRKGKLVPEKFSLAFLKALPYANFLAMEMK